MIIILPGTQGSIVDTVTLSPIQPTSGILACPGQNVTINCTVTRVIPPSESMAEQPTLTWLYRNISLEYKNGSLSSNSDSLNNGVYTAVFSDSHFFIVSTATIINVPLSHQNSSIQCSATFGIAKLKKIQLAGNNYNYYNTVIIKLTNRCY